MNKVAFFVEGYTEARFVSRLIHEIATKNSYQIEHRDYRGQVNRRSWLLSATDSNGTAVVKAHYLVVDCHGDGGGRRVKEIIVENIESLHNAGFSHVFGLWDLRPNFTLAQWPEVRRLLYHYVPTKYAKAHLHIAVAEIEAWILQEKVHFLSICPSLTEAVVATEQLRHGGHSDPEKIENSYSCLNAIYGGVGHQMDKRRRDSIDITIDALSIENLYLNRSSLSETLKSFMDDFDSVVGMATAS